MARINDGKRGTPHSVRNAHANMRMLIEVPPPPPGMNDAATAIWYETGGILVDRLDLSEGDLAQLEMFATNLDLLRQISTQLEADGLTIMTEKGPVLHPLITAKKSAEVQVKATSAALGLSPVARKALKHVDVSEGRGAVGGDF